MQRQANFLPKEPSLLESKKRYTLPPDPSNTRIQGVYADIWQQPAQSWSPVQHAGRSHSSLEFRQASSLASHAEASQTWQQRVTTAEHHRHDAQDPPTVPHSSASTPIKPPAGLQQVRQLARWLETETLHFNETFAERQLSSPALEFLLLATKQARQLHSKAFYELTKQVTEECKERGELMADVWIAHTTILETVMTRMHQLCLEDRDRAVIAESEKRNIAGVLGEEIQTLHFQNRSLQEEVGILKKQLQDVAVKEAAAAAAKEGGRRPKKGLGPAPLLTAVPVPAALASQKSLAPNYGHQGIESASFPQTALGRMASGMPAAFPGAAGSPLQGAGGSGLGSSGGPPLGRYNSVLNDGLFNSLQMRPGSIIDELAEAEPGYLAKQNKELRRLLVECRKELYEAYENAGDLERQSELLVPLQSKLELAINERDAAIAKAEGLTPRPGLRAFDGLTPKGCKKLGAAFDAHRKWPAEDLARMLMGEEDTQHQSVLQSAPFIFACMAKPLADRALVRQDIATALAQASLQPFLTHLIGQQLAWLQRHMQLTAETHAQEEGRHDWSLLVDFMCGSSARGYAYSTEWYGSLREHFQGNSIASLARQLEAARISTAHRVSVVEAENDSLRQQLAEAKKKKPLLEAASDDSTEEEARARAEAASKQKEAEEAAVMPNPINEYIEMLEEEDEANLKADFPSMGSGPDIPRVFKTGSRVRNKNITKRQTEMLVKEIWKVRMAHRKAGKAGVELVEMIFLHLQKTKGLHQAVIETGYNLLYGCWKYSWDADCELFLKILRGEVKEDVYVEQIQLQHAYT
ncbi:TPA: Translin-associated factor X-interacting protein 1 [Trebouxia sp. C0005]